MMWALGNRINVSDMELRSGKLLETKNLTMNEIQRENRSIGYGSSENLIYEQWSECQCLASLGIAPPVVSWQVGISWN